MQMKQSLNNLANSTFIYQNKKKALGSLETSDTYFEMRFIELMQDITYICTVHILFPQDG